MSTDAHQSGLIVIWNDIVSECRDNFLEWHSREHIPERVAIPGFLRGQRWFGESASPQYLTIYSTADASVLTSAAYLARLNSPTPWTQRSVADFETLRERQARLCGGRLALQAASSCLRGLTLRRIALPRSPNNGRGGRSYRWPRSQGLRGSGLRYPLPQQVSCRPLSARYDRGISKNLP